MNMLQPTLVVLLLLTGMGVALLGSIKIPLARRLNMDEGRVGGLLSLFGFGMGPTILLAGFLTDHVGPQVVLMSGSVIFAVSLAALGLARSYQAALAAVLLFSAVGRADQRGQCADAGRVPEPIGQSRVGVQFRQRLLWPWRIS